MIISYKERQEEIKLRNKQPIAFANKTGEEIVAEQKEKERSWRDSELKASDFIVTLTDHPKHAAYMTYRQELRDYPAQEYFPNDTRPVKP